MIAAAACLDQQYFPPTRVPSGSSRPGKGCATMVHTALVWAGYCLLQPPFRTNAVADTISLGQQAPPGLIRAATVLTR